jgi:hypothetical protein
LLDWQAFPPGLHLFLRYRVGPRDRKPGIQKSKIGRQDQKYRDTDYFIEFAKRLSWGAAAEEAFLYFVEG